MGDEPERGGDQRSGWRVPRVREYGGVLAAGEDIDEAVTLENDSVRVALLTFPPGSASGEHVNPGPEMGIILEGELTLITPDGREVLGPGATRWLPPYTTHDARNEGTAPVKLWPSC